MRHRTTVVMIAFAALSAPAYAVIQRPVALRDVLHGKSFIFIAHVEQIVPDKGMLVISVGDVVKETFPHRQLTIDLFHGDTVAQREKQAQQLLERLAPKMDLVCMGMTLGTRSTIFAFTNGTWFQIFGPADAPKQFRFVHFEPYLRRTFKGTTAELQRAVIDGLRGTREPPGIDPNEPPGIGPPVKR